MLRIYDTVIALLKLLGPVFDKIAERDPDLARQGRRAASSIALNIAEGAGVRAGNRRSRYRTALGSALEVRAVLDIAEALDYIEEQAALVDAFDRVARTLFKLMRR